MNKEEQAIVDQYNAGTLRERAENAARRNEQGFKEGWTVEQHEAWFIAKAVSLIQDQQTVEAKQVKQPSSNSARVYNTGFGYYGTAKDAARGFDGIE